ncbi:hypothetical protein CFN78_10070 [Amycolatopsis antarctica]|uniref:PE domain-containing protein n=1 Tax=Amycolatopsis antarctica TaxID=1854586 RepID=A0A263D6J8_9PSEU|nr:hypothetical protein [Amycolatopsis antarctica]OZM73207.1 hypothetical protein CFN78_10070 [Amycolatopsis antarctica]
MAGGGNAFLSGVLGADMYGGAQGELEREVVDTRRDAEAEHRVVGAGDGGVTPGGFVESVTPTGSTTGGGYTLDPEALAAKITEFEAIRDRIADRSDDLKRAAERVEPPSLDAPAIGQADATRRSLLVAAEHAGAMREYAQSFIDALRKANGTYVTQEDDTTGVFKDQAGADTNLPTGTGSLFE